MLRAFVDRHPIALDHDAVEIESAASIAAALRRVRPSLVINTAAFHNVDRCEAEPDRAFAVNALAVDRLAAACAAGGIALAHISTDYVFAGTATRPYSEEDAARPLNVYGASKLAGESLIARHGGQHFIVRTSGLYGRAGSSTKGYTFIERVLGQARSGQPVRVVTDVTSSPSYTLHVAQGIRRVIERGESGLYHVTNAGACSWYEFAQEAFTLAGIAHPIEPTTQAAFTSTVKRPAYSALAHGAAERLGIAPMPDWRAGLRAYLAERAGGG